MRSDPSSQALRVLVLAVFASVGIAALVQIGDADRRPRPTVGYAVFEPPAPAGHADGVCVRLTLPAGQLARPARDHPVTEAGVETTAGDRLFYLAVALVPATDPDPLGEYVRRNDLAGRAGFADVSAEVQVTGRGPAWVQRYTDARLPDDRRRSAEPAAVAWDRLAVVRVAEGWHDSILEWHFYLPPGRANELGPLVWQVVREAEVTVRPAP